MGARPPDTKEIDVDITIGVQNLTRELVIDSNETADAVSAKIAQALDGGKLLELTDAKGRRVLVPTASIGYIEIGSSEQHRVGFGGIS